MRTGQVVGGRYRLEARLGSGSQGEVWRAADLRLHERAVALKRALTGGDASAAAKVRKESEVLASLNHPNVVTVHDAVEEDGDWWIVMEFVSGRSLADLGTVTADEAARYGAQLAGGLEAVHAKGILHRDIKPANVLVTEQGQAKLADFGIARQVHAEPTLTGTGVVTGTPGYVAPEVVRGGRYTAAADVFSLGATLFHAVEGTSPFGEGNAHALLWRTAQGDRVEPRRAGALEPVLDRLLDGDPKRRIRIAEAHAELARLSGQPVAARRADRRRGWIWAAAVASALVVLAAVVWPALRPAESGGEPGDGTPRGGVPVDYIGDPRTADPCSLLDAEALGAYGRSRLDTDNGNFGQCDVVLDTDAGWVYVELYFYVSQGEPEPGPTTMSGPIGVIRYEGDHEECQRTLVLPDGSTFISIETRQDESGESDLCAIGETATETALAILAAGEIPRRTIEDPSSLYALDACELLEGEGLERFPGVNAHEPLRAFGGWGCDWYSTTSDRELRLVFDRSDPPTAADGTLIQAHDRTAIIQGDHWGEGSCLVSIAHRTYPSGDGDGTTTTEFLRVLVSGDDPEEELCALATDIAQPAAKALPDA
ncbi:serine/threonine-protein kinase [Glycomyces terrestris]|uniref:non-specific serine/threonine protein kinase n=1 Tax=Glycomyces terrestris TaxID=2493553 RepID=A0A426V428_9ACTN|nr:serine/threonine-protein kinase [Glycomyces terrestris]RRS01595.1 serine/threonine protein kinase [Glycomyces terrestris]